MFDVKRLFSIRLVVPLLVLILASNAQGAPFSLHKNSKGLIEPFQVKELDLERFVREFSRVAKKKIQISAPWSKQLKGSVTISIGDPLDGPRLTEVFHQVLNSNGYSVVDTPDGKAWTILRIRDARDSSLPVYSGDDVPSTWRLVTVIHELKHVRADEVSRYMRSFMPANSRIIPVGHSRVAITDTGVNIKSKVKLIGLLDTVQAGEVAAKEREYAKERHLKKLECRVNEQIIEKVSVENFEVNNLDMDKKERWR